MNSLFGKFFFDGKSPEITSHYKEFNDYIILFEGEIYNHEELISSLNLNESPSDFELVYYALKRWGEDAPRKIIGDYSFVVWDKVNRSLFSARDHFGGIPLVYWHLSNKSFVVTTSTDSLLSLSEFPRDLDETRIADYLVGDLGETLDNERTFYLSAKRVPAGHSLTVNDKRLELLRFWNPHNSRYTSENISTRDTAEKFQEIFWKSIKSRTKNSKKIGVSLSGGLDSGSIFSLIRNKGSTDTNITPFSLMDDNEESRWESDGIAEHLKDWGLHSVLIKPKDAEEAFQEISRTTTHSSELFDHRYNIFYSTLFHEMKKFNVDSALGGIDGDLITSSNPYLLGDLLRKGRFMECLRELPGLSKHYNVSPLTLFLQFGVLPLTSLSYQFSFKIRKLFNRVYASEQFKLPAKELLKRTNYFDRIKIFEESLLTQRTAKDVQAHALKAPSLQSTREAHWRISKRFNIKFLQPFLDPQLAEFCLSLENNEKFYRGYEKHILRRSMKGILPEKVRTQNSHGGGVGYEFRVRYLKRFEEEILKTAKNRLSDLSYWINREYLDDTIQLWKRHRCEGYEDEILRVYALSQWLQQSNKS